MKIQGPFRVDVPAKVTLHLRILQRLSDGYHSVRIALAPVALYDRLYFTLGGAPGVTLSVRGAPGTDTAALGQPQDNLVVRAARAFEAALGAPLAVAVRLEKHIPAGAGLGGGSADAAATLVALNRWHGHPVGPDRLHALATALGADVPFFLEPQPAWAEGIGERLRPLGRLAPLDLLVVRPPLAIATGAAYGLSTAEADGGPLPPPDAREPDFGTRSGTLAGLCNAFEPVLLPRYPVLGEIKAALRGAGAEGSLLSGSGSAVFGIFADAAARDAAARTLAPTAAGQGWHLLPCHTLASHRYDFVF